MTAEKVRTNVESLLVKIRDALNEERAETQEMLAIYQRFVQGKASDEEMERANDQFKSFLKTIGLGIVVVLPFSPITIPAIAKLGKKYNVDVFPNSFKKED